MSDRTEFKDKLYFYSDPSHIAEGFLAQFAHEAGVYVLRYWRDEFFNWDSRRYVKVPETELKSHIAEHIERTNASLNFGDEPTVRVTTTLVNNVMLNVKAKTLLGFDNDPDIWLASNPHLRTIAFKNGLVDIGCGRPKLTEHTPLYFTFNYLPYEYRPDADCPQWEKFLEDITEGDKEVITLLQQWAGYLLAETLREHKFMLLAGSGSNGKTTFAGVIERMLGRENVSHVPLSQFGSRFALVQTLGKMLNSTSESSHRIDELAETVLKAYVSGDRMTFERKFRDPVHAEPTAKVMISTNQLPSFADRTFGIWRRMLYVPFERSFTADEQDKFLLPKLCSELPGIFNWARRGRKMIMSPEGFIQPKRCKEALDNYQKDSNPARRFLEENYSYDLGLEGTACGQMYRRYRQWCEMNGYRALNNSNFGKEVRRVFPKIARQQAKSGPRRVTVYSGISVIEGSEVAQPEFSLEPPDGKNYGD